MRFVFLALALSGFLSGLFAQDTLPKFSVRNVGGNRVIIGWVNAYPVIKQISIQRSHDSLKNYKTILTVADPSAVQNGFADTKAPNDHMYYRLFVNVDRGEYFVTEAKQPVPDSIRRREEIIPEDKQQAVEKTNVPVIKKPDLFVPSFYVYTNRDGYLFINLPDADQKKYSIKFFEEDDTPLFELKNVSEPALTLDKANFYHSGWFKFELYNNEKLIERHKFYISKDF